MAPDWFCERYHCWMMRSACDARRKKAITTRFGRGGGENIFATAGCHNCQQEDTMKKEIKPEEVEVERECRVCGQVKKMKAFNSNKECKNGRERTCKECKKSRIIAKYNQLVDSSVSGGQESPPPEQQVMTFKSDIENEEKELMNTISNEDLSINSSELTRSMSETREIVLGVDNYADLSASIREMPFDKITRLQPGMELIPKTKTLTIDFKNHPELFQAVETIAMDEFRTPEMQVLFWLRNHLVSSGDSRYRGKLYSQG
jgi:hypothetical protein